MTSTTKPVDTPYDFIYGWGDNIEGSGVPSPETLKQAGRALHAVHEFVIEPIAEMLKELSEESGPEESTVTYEDIGRLITWTDELRLDCNSMLDTIGDIALIAHEDFPNLAEGCKADGVMNDPKWAARMRRFHGLATRKDG